MRNSDLLRGIQRFATSSLGRTLTGITASVVAVGTVFYHLVEGWSWFDSAYFSVITLTTVGYGDFSPQTNLGKLFTIAYVLVGIGLLITFITEVAENILSANKERTDRRRDM